MLAFQLYLNSPKAKRVLTTKPGEEGFSLIELVVVVAVLAILAAIAIPSFSSLNAEARVAGAKATLANLAKECAVKLVDSDQNNQTYVAGSYAASGHTLTHQTGAVGVCDPADVFQLAANDNSTPTFRYNAATGAKTCINGTGTGDNLALGCNAGTW